MWARAPERRDGERHPCDAIRERVRVPSILHPTLNGIAPRTARYRAFYSFWAPFYRVLRAIAPSYVTDTHRVSLAMLHAVRHDAPQWIVKTRDINALARLATRDSASSVQSTP